MSVASVASTPVSIPIPKPKTQGLSSSSDTQESSALSEEALFDKERQELTSAFSEKCYPDQDTLLTLKGKFPHANGIIGDLPQDWNIGKTATENINNKYKIFNLFKQTMKKIRQDFHGNIRLVNGILKAALRLINESEEKPVTLDSELGTGLHTLGVVKEAQPIKFEVVGEGTHGTVHRFDVNQKSYALKLFKQALNTLATKDLHGSPVEQNRAAFIHQLAPESQYAHFYFGDIDAGYMVTELIDQQHLTTSTPVPIDLTQLGLKHYDIRGNKDNSINDRIVDYGGIDMLSSN